MTLSTWLLYATAVFILTATPGPSVVMSISTAVQYGPRKAMLAASGSTIAIAGLMTLSMLGLGTLLAASESLFFALKVLGALYLAYLGLSALLSKSSALSIPGQDSLATPVRSHLLRGALVGMSNPKALLFFGALFPQFINPAAEKLPQFLILGSTFLAMELSLLTIYIFSASRARHWLQAPHRARLFNKLTGVVFLAAASIVAMADSGRAR